MDDLYTDAPPVGVDDDQRRQVLVNQPLNTQPPVNAPPVDPSYSDLGNMLAGANSQPPVRSGANATAPPAPPVSQPPVSTQPAPSMPTAPPVSTPNLRSDVMAGNVAPPVSADYKPTIPSSKSTWLNRLAAGMVGFKNPQAGVAIRQRFEQEPITRANEAYQRDTGEYNTAFNQELTRQNETRAEANEKREEAQTQADVAYKKAQTKNLLNPPEKQGLTPEETTIHDLMTGNNGQPRTDLKTGKPYDYLGAYTAVKQAAADTKAEKLNDFEQYYKDFITDNHLPDSPHNRLLARQQYAAAGQAPERPPHALMIGPDNKAIDVRPGTVIPTGAKTATEVGGQPKADLATREKVLTYYKPAQDADVRLQLMEKNEQDALKGNQQAMVNLLANHIALTMGLPRGKVPRVNYQMFQEAQESAPILQRAEAHFDKDGYLTGVVLTPEQMHFMVNLGHETRDAEWQSADSSADYIGIGKDDRPKSIYSEAQGNGKSISVQAGGKSYKFKDQASADAFKKEAGIK
jgi:hypothetical protein